MSAQQMEETARALVAPGKGILAMDESLPTIKKRFDAISLESTEDTRRAYRELLLTAPELEEFIAGVILFDETLRQSTRDGTPFTSVLRDKGIIAGIKVDAGAKPLAAHPGEKVTEGLDGLRERLAEYGDLGARFAKWRAVIAIGDGIPSGACLQANAHALARYAGLCQEAGLVPIVEPEVLIDGDHSIERCFEATEATLHRVFDELYRQGVTLECTLLKASMVLSGKACSRQAGVQEVAEQTVRCLKRAVPAALPGVVFLSGGQSAERATAHLNAMNAMDAVHPWPLGFSYARALQEPALKVWAGSDANLPAAQRALYHRAKLNSLARQGRYDEGMEKAAA